MLKIETIKKKKKKKNLVAHQSAKKINKIRQHF